MNVTRKWKGNKQFKNKERDLFMYMLTYVDKVLTCFVYEQDAFLHDSFMADGWLWYLMCFI